MMKGTASYLYGQGDGYHIIDLPYEGRDVFMTIVLPDTGRFDEIRTALSSSWLTEARDAMTSTRVELSLSKFTFTSGSISLKEPLTALGLGNIFTEGADFSKMLPSEANIRVDDVYHSAFVSVDEYGTEAAASTAVIINPPGIVDPPIPLVIDRPFLLLIQDASGLVLFAGQILVPQS
jgi:serpin B